MSLTTINKTNYVHFLNLRDQLCSLEFKGINNHYFNNWTNRSVQLGIEHQFDLIKNRLKLG